MTKFPYCPRGKISNHKTLILKKNYNCNPENENKTIEKNTSFMAAYSSKNGP